MPYDSGSGTYIRRATTVLDETPDGDTVNSAVATKLDTSTDDAVTDLNHHNVNGGHYPATSVNTDSRYLKQSPAGMVSWASGVPIDQAALKDLSNVTAGVTANINISGNAGGNAATSTDLAVGSVLSVGKGGTGGNTQSTARDGLGLGSSAIRDSVTTSSGAGDSGKIPVLDATGKIPSGFVDINISQSTETAAGIAELATSSEAQSGTNDTTIITPKKLRDGLNASGAAPVYACRAWVNFNGTGTVAIRASGNVTSVTDNGVGDYTLNFTTPMPDANYTFAQGSGQTGNSMIVANDNGILRTTSALRLQTCAVNGTLVDPITVTIAIFR